MCVEELALSLNPTLPYLARAHGLRTVDGALSSNADSSQVRRTGYMEPNGLPRRDICAVAAINRRRRPPSTANQALNKQVSTPAFLARLLPATVPAAPAMHKEVVRGTVPACPASLPSTGDIHLDRTYLLMPEPALGCRDLGCATTPSRDYGILHLCHPAPSHSHMLLITPSRSDFVNRRPNMDVLERTQHAQANMTL